MISVLGNIRAKGTERAGGSQSLVQHDELRYALLCFESAYSLSSLRS